MAFCSSCGTKVIDGAKFCQKCGVPTNSASSNHESQRQQEYGGKVIKCPNCGEELKSFWTLCPVCGYELRGAHATSSVKEFDIRFNQTKTIGQKIDLIKTFAVPNTKEDTLEFLILAVSNIVPEAYSSANEYSVARSLSDAWISKYEQVAQKAKIMLNGLSDFTEIQKEYFDKLEKIKISKKTGRKLKKAQKHEAKYKGKDWNERPAGVGIILLIVLVGCSLMIFLPQIAFLGEEKEYGELQGKLENLVVQVQDCINNEDWETARIKAYQIIDDSGWSDDSKEKWNNIRDSLIALIEEKQALAEGKITIGIKPSDLKGRHYETVVAQLQEKGFVNIKTVAKGNLVTGLINKDGVVRDVTIDGSSEFDIESKYVSSIEIIVSYNSFKD